MSALFATVRFMGTKYAMLDTRGWPAQREGRVMINASTRTLAAGAGLCSPITPVAAATLLGPSSYFSFADSPFVGVGFNPGTFHLIT